MRSLLPRPAIALLLLCTAGAAMAHFESPPSAESLAAGVVPSPRGTVFLAPAQLAASESSRLAADPSHSFYFSRAAYGGGGWGRGRSWATDYPKADQQFLTVLRRLTKIDAFPDAHPIRLDGPEVRRFPFLYAVEVGYMSLSDAEVRGLREYLLAGGFLVADDFWGTSEWNNFARQMQRVFPEYPIVEMPMDHPIFSALYDIDEIIQVPNVGQGMAGGATHERDGYQAHARGIFDDRGRLMVIINWNTDLGDAWEWAEQERYPLRFSTYAYQMGANFIIYSMTH